MTDVRIYRTWVARLRRMLDRSPQPEAWSPSDTIEILAAYGVTISEVCVRAQVPTAQLDGWLSLVREGVTMAQRLQQGSDGSVAPPMTGRLH